MKVLRNRCWNEHGQLIAVKFNDKTATARASVSVSACERPYRESSSSRFYLFYFISCWLVLCAFFFFFFLLFCEVFGAHLGQHVNVINVHTLDEK